MRSHRVQLNNTIVEIRSDKDSHHIASNEKKKKKLKKIVFPILNCRFDVFTL